eukprot:6870778-Alexandrium_andersonii.AAC.1
MSASLVGSEMCIRDRGRAGRGGQAGRWACEQFGPFDTRGSHAPMPKDCVCLLYTSDAADDM